MKESFGARLRQHRERRGVSIAEVAERTKIKASLLEGLERDDISQWPAGIFRRSWVRTYATAIGFDVDEAVREFVDRYPEPVEPVEPPAPRGLRGLVASALGSLRKPAAAVATTGERPADHPPPAAAAVPAEPPVAPRVAEAAARVSTPALRVSTPAPRITNLDVRASPSTPRAQRPAPDFLAAAKICTELGRVEESGQVLPLLRDAAALLGARGLIVWVWDAVEEELKPVFVHGYPAKVRARLRGVGAGADNVTAAAFRASAPLAVSGGDGGGGALAIPLLGPSRCVGVLALELPDGLEEDAGIRAAATFFAAMLAQLVGAAADGSAAEPAVPSSLEVHPG
jgi:transcriptional regulator with XRE-family HTH domain